MPIKILLCYARKDEMFVTRLRAHMSLLRRQGMVEVLHSRDISDIESEPELRQHLDAANIILLIVSADFLASDFCSDGKELIRAIERHERGEARVIPIIYRPCFWKRTPFGKLLALPTGGKPASNWGDFDFALQDITEGIDKAIKELTH